ncbi:uncharacterized protein LOC115341525 isoform X2 [Aquila chrysaetos chrysaetos]|uniref:uncharacterized protein LOC115341525 isoform X2 n=1 Tax=Aquila chrysaetos chrysaetos TaxID=223781 RepID=UPI0011773019|nr:uncharacterized protein LOC115341525 isoform X2 [Aquila chrysaetos chrysaetos]
MGRGEWAGRDSQRSPGRLRIWATVSTSFGFAVHTSPWAAPPAMDPHPCPRPQLRSLPRALMRTKGGKKISFLGLSRVKSRRRGLSHSLLPPRNETALACSPGSERTVQQKLRESFAVPRLLVNGLAAFLIELVHFLGETVVQVLVVGLLTAISDHILKPFLAATFNSLLQPLLLFLLKVLCGIRDLTDPLIDVLAAVCSQLAVVLRAVRLVEINLQPDRRTDLGDVGSS